MYCIRPAIFNCPYRCDCPSTECKLNYCQRAVDETNVNLVAMHETLTRVPDLISAAIFRSLEQLAEVQKVKAAIAEAENGNIPAEKPEEPPLLQNEERVTRARRKTRS